MTRVGASEDRKVVYNTIGQFGKGSTIKNYNSRDALTRKLSIQIIVVEPWIIGILIENVVNTLYLPTLKKK